MNLNQLNIHINKMKTKFFKISITVLIISVVLTFLIITIALYESDSYKKAKSHVLCDNNLKNQIGEIEKIYFWSKGVKIIDYGYMESSEVSVKVKGKDEDAFLIIYLTNKDSKEWNVDSMKILKHFKRQ